jgi:hypothetical protein
MFGGFQHRPVAPRAEHRRLSQIQFGDPVDTALLELLTGTSKDNLRVKDVAQVPADALRKTGRVAQRVGIGHLQSPN